ncbi:SAVMC3_10250 family protein [Amycolatopsis rifamycinica]|nr:SAVMC3_10250 family protein [Amycolatopsis rifamycinica]
MEYVYLSHAKLAEFLPVEQRWWSRIRAKKFAAKAGAAGAEVSLEFEPVEAAASTARLEKIRDHIGEAGRWFEEPGLTPGEWVFFEGRIGYQALEGGAVLFCQSGELKPSGNRIVLHGTAAHLMSTTAAATPLSSVPPGGYSNQGGAVAVLAAALGRPEKLEVAERQFWRRFTGNAPEHPFAGPGSLTRHVETLFEEVACTDWFRTYSPFLVGCARVSAVVESSSLPFDVVVASPLFVRRARP